jgi:hypothetical protein
MKQLRKFYKYMNSDEGSFRQKVLRSGIWLGLGSTIIRLMELFRSILLARLLLSEVFGLMGIIHLMRAGIGQLSSASFNEAIIYRNLRLRTASILPGY